ncbi:MAG TPA: hypothetical protein VFM42_01880, partial [Sphingomicrobium sp.]|nr:hypothetical protein [Sphingomicrobium sp.]
NLDCAEAEGVVGGAVLGMLQAGDYSPTGKSKNGWYQGELGFTFTGDEARTPAVAQTSNAQNQQLVSNGPDQNEVVCHKIHEIGSRIDVKRICMTRAQWAEEERQTKNEVNRIQTQRGCRDTC